MDHVGYKSELLQEELHEEDEILVERAKAGDQEAFGELVRRHRSKVYGYARSYTHEAFQAEDIVQDALIRAFLHLGTLVDSRRFLPWLHRIVRNQAYTRLQKGPHRRERVFSGLINHKSDSSDPSPTDWEDLNSILHRLGRTWSSSLEHAGDPAEVIMRRELLQTITGMLHCLNPRERRVVESHFFDHLSPMEIARLFSMSQANVYQVLSRSRKKLIQEKTRVVVDQYVKTRKDAGIMKQVVLRKPEAFTLQTWITCAAALHGLVEYTDRKMSLPMVLGLSGHAFRLTVVPGEIHIAGPTMFPFAKVLQQGLRNMGFTSKVVGGGEAECAPGPNATQVSPALLTPDAREKRPLAPLLPEALELIHRTIDRGYPVLAWDLFIPEFGLIYGYDDDRKQLHAGDNCGHDKTIAFEHLGRGLIEELFVLAIENIVEIDQRKMLKGAIQTALTHYLEEGSDKSCANGLLAYAAWQEAFHQGSIEPNGNAYTSVVVQNARRNASLFWSEIAATWTDATFDDIRPVLQEASTLYGQMADEYAKLSKLFPFPAGGEPNEPEQSKQAIALLQGIESQERKAIALLRHMLEKLSA
ncbi:RNA polymerase sigma factor [Brevibacillus sp. NRS-1366]|uniref:RNA polymerase sigma factor n=1 Tax=Brevibacillus sp. NRS-1366 TaxID=3233899 RepID=UPI003D1C4CB1